MWEHAGKRVPVHSDLQFPEGRPISGKTGTRRKKRLRRFRFSGKVRAAKLYEFPRFCRDTGPPSTAGFVFLDGVNLHGRRSAGEFAIWP
jgi:hypothetical protein